ncbi:hypothetical protein M2310_003162 [Rhizobium leguminosarum]|uniref:Uncharacterized protein n=1 Tax=Rhizobium esperanzae TaxID=1967781 RepID=A0A7W6UMV5_9HYPH|nr:hypothetical protein [Rhizobium esperanzae]MDH6202481.1 hypothetical protein [Rhizobium leguminosarum]
MTDDGRQRSGWPEMITGLQSYILLLALFGLSLGLLS